MTDWRVYLVTDPSAHGGVVGTALTAARAGAGVVQLRDKLATDAAMIAEARALKAGLDPLGVPLIINDRIAVARAVGAAGVHVGQGDDSVARARAVLGPDAIVGLSVENDAQLAAVDWSLVDYIGASPIHATPTKPDHAPPLGLEGLARFCSKAKGPVIAIGGLGVDDAAGIRRAGAAGMAVVSAICAADNTAAATKALLQAWEAP